MNRLLAAAGVVDVINVNMIGRFVSAWFRGDFIFKSPMLIPHLRLEVPLGLFYHYAIGSTFAACYLWLRGRFGVTSLWSALAFGVLTSLASLLFIFPAIGAGFFGLVVPGGRLLITSLINHSFFGLGLYLGSALALRIGHVPEPEVAAARQ